MTIPLVVFNIFYYLQTVHIRVLYIKLSHCFNRRAYRICNVQCIHKVLAVTFDSVDQLLCIYYVIGEFRLGHATVSCR